MKKLIYFAFVAVLIAVTSCSEDFLEKKNLYEQSDESYYRTENDINEALTAAYASLAIDEGNNNPILVPELLSDDRFGGGGMNDDGFHATDAFALPPDVNYYMPTFRDAYQGILRVNMILKRKDNAEFSGTVNGLTADERKNQAIGETYFLRALFYFRLAQAFGTVPLKTDPAPANLPRATPEELYGQIASDLVNAIQLMPSIRYQSIPVARLGHATKWAAQGLMARVFLFYTGYYNKTEITLPEGGSVTKSQVISWVDDCVANSGHDLLPDPRQNWPYASLSDTDYPYNSNIPALPGAELGKWAGEEGGNYETVFAVKYSPYGTWSPTGILSYSNQLLLYSGLRQQYHVPFGFGWGAGPVNPQLWDSFEPGDVRKEGFILNVNAGANPQEGDILNTYVWGADNQVQETGFWNKKYMPIYVFQDANNAWVGLWQNMYGSPTSEQLKNMQDDVLIRFADILLMGAELGSSNAQNYLDKVRSRAGLGSVAPTLENIKIERRHELAFEGLRYYDLLRWHDAEEAFNVATNIPVKNLNIDETYTVDFRPETGGFLPIPQSEIDLSDGVLEQTPGYTE